jgi:hypothetical protein
MRWDVFARPILSSSRARAGWASPRSPQRWPWTAARTGRSVLLAEMEGRGEIARTLEVPDPGIPGANDRRRPCRAVHHSDGGGLRDAPIQPVIADTPERRVALAVLAHERASAPIRAAEERAIAAFEARAREPIVLVPELAGDIHDVAGLRRLGPHLFGRSISGR